MMDIVKPKQTSIWKRRKMVWALAGGASVAIVLFLTFGLGNANPVVARTDLWIDIAQQGEMKREIRASGTLVPRDSRWVVAGAGATVQQVLVLPGAKVMADTPIMTLTNPELQAALEKTEAILAGADADIIATRAELAAQLLDHKIAYSQTENAWKLAQIKAQANQRAHEAGAISRIELQQSQLAQTQAHEQALLEQERVHGFQQHLDAQIKVATARRDEAKSAAIIARSQVEGLTVRAGIDGILQQVEVEEGQQVEIGSKLARVVQPDELIARLQVPEMLAKDLALALAVSVDTRSGVTAGEIIRIDPAVRDGSVTIDVAFTETLPPGARPDLSVDGRIELGALTDVVHIARPGMATANGDGILFVVHPGEKVAQRVQVRYGAASSERIEIREGILPGDEVVLSESNRFLQYEKLRLR